MAIPNRLRATSAQSDLVRYERKVRVKKISVERMIEADILPCRYVVYNGQELLGAFEYISDILTEVCGNNLMHVVEWDLV
jgi:hypothetical protein